jgi:predicted enzyme related to lactoylglutathione lyase
MTFGRGRGLIYIGTFEERSMMSERANYPPGVHCWADLATPDLEAAVKFYGDLFGWEVPELPDSAEMGGYRRAKKNGADVAGMMPLMQEGQPTAWSTYVSVEDAEATAAAVREAGGSVVAEPMDVMGLGHMALFTDPTGAFLGIWQPGTFAGAGIVNEPGALSWTELNTRDPEAAKAFYGTVFGWEFEEVEFEGLGSYITIKLDGESIAGMLDMTGRVPDEVPPNWLAYFGVEDADTALETVKSGGGNVAFGPVEVTAGRFAVVSDPFGAVFAVIQAPEEAAA